MHPPTTFSKYFSDYSSMKLTTNRSKWDEQKNGKFFSSGVKFGVLELGRLLNRLMTVYYCYT